jgi:hypothetical protein
MTVSPIFAQDSAAFIQCQQIKPHGKFQAMKQKKNCFRDLARSLQEAAKSAPISAAQAELDAAIGKCLAERPIIKGGVCYSEEQCRQDCQDDGIKNSSSPYLGG